MAKRGKDNRQAPQLPTQLAANHKRVPCQITFDAIVFAVLRV
jgi:hypothetical protein